MKKIIKILIVDDELIMCKSCAKIISNMGAGYQTETTQNPIEALKKIKSTTYNLLITDIQMAEMNGLDLVNQALVIDPNLIIIVMTGFASYDNAVMSIKAGASDYISKPFEPKEFIYKIEKSLKINKKIKSKNNIPEFVIGNNPDFLKVIDLINKISISNVIILIQGESGTGKEIIAKYIHSKSLRKAEPFNSLNCASIHKSLHSSELFGYKKGSFTGAETNHKGIFEASNSGTLFLDEIGDLALDVQASLLRTIEEGTIRPIGSTEEKQIDVRLICATNKNLYEQVKVGAFRLDLFYRINVVAVTLPSLRERKTDIPEFCDYFIKKYNKKYNKNITNLDNNVLNFFYEYTFLGNIRELENILEYAILTSNDNIIKMNNLPLWLKITKSDSTAETEDKISSLEEVENRHIKKILSITNNNISQAAELLKIDRSTLHRKLKKI